MCSHVKYTLFLILTLSVSITNGQAPINILSVQQGLPRSQIYDIVQDSVGFLWLGSRDGLVRYDGHSPKIYKSSSTDIPFNYVYDLLLDDQNRLWMTSNADYKGVAYLDLSTNEFLHFEKSKYPTLANNGVVSIAQDVQGTIAMLTKDFHLSLYDEERGEFDSWALSDYLPGKIPVVNVGGIIADPKHPKTFWICALEGLFKFDCVHDTIQLGYMDYGWTPVSFYYESSFPQQLWVALSSKGGLLRISLEDHSTKFFSIDTSFQVQDELRTEDLSTFMVHSIARKSSHELFVGTGNLGIGVFDKRTGTFDFEQHKSERIDNDFVRVVYSNEAGEFWAGADKTGLYYLRPQIAQLELELFPERNNERSQFRMSDIMHLEGDRYILSFYAYPEIWIWDRSIDQYEKILFEDQEHYAYRVFDHQGKFFLATNQGFHELDVQKKKIRPDAITLPDKVKNINNVVLDSSGIWFVAWGVGVMNYDNGEVYVLEGGSFTGLRHRWTHDLALDGEGNLWVGQENGLYSVSRETREITTHSHRDSLTGFGNPNFKALTFDHLGRLWVGNFGTGLTCFDPDSYLVKTRLGVAEGLPADRIYDLITDDEGYIWVWTSDGLCSFYPEEDDQNIRIRYYPDTKYFPVDRLGIWFVKLKNGEIFFGVSGGFVHFDPIQLRETDLLRPSAPVITGFKVFDEDLSTGLVNCAGGIDLRYDQNFFRINFSAPQSGFMAQQTFNYRLSQVDEDWVDSRASRTATYTNIEPGTYYFQMRVADQYGSWSQASEPLVISISPPWYGTVIAKAIGLVLLCGILFGIIRILVVRERMKNRMLLQQIESENLRALDETKSNFFTQISHEFRTPLTVILGMADQLKQQINGSIRMQKSIDAIDRNGKLLLKQINQILDLSKLQSDAYTLDMSQGNIIPSLRYLTEAFAAYALSRDIDLRFCSRVEMLEMDFDRERIQDIYTNLLSNALKFTPSGGRVEVNIDRQDVPMGSNLLLSVEDSGVGIDPEDLDRIFEPYYQGSNLSDSAGTGLGLATTKQWVEAMGGKIEVESIKGKGSSFQITIPISNRAPRIETWTKDAFTNGTLQEHREVPPPLPKDKPTVLVIEDSNDVTEYLLMCLDGNFRVLTARDGDHGLHLAFEKIPDLILTDVMMPGKDGYEVTAIIRGQEITSHIPIIMLTAKVTQDDKNSGLALGVDAYLTKPFDQEELLIRIHSLLEQRRILQRKYAQNGRVDLHKEVVMDQEDQFLAKVINYVDLNLSNDFTVEDLAKDLNLSRVQLYRKVKALTGNSISAYVRTIRLHRSHHYLSTTDKSISEIAYETGFSDPGYFTKAFKELFSLTPSEFRKG
ncbi:MAG: ATP-binding protein [Saprospiraceae bacterium]|nr:ATP-binding protein [Saprospiraceae bacterium]